MAEPSTRVTRKVVQGAQASITQGGFNGCSSRSTLSCGRWCFCPGAAQQPGPALALFQLLFGSLLNLGVVAAVIHCEHDLVHSGSKGGPQKWANPEDPHVDPGPRCCIRFFWCPAPPVLLWSW